MDLNEREYLKKYKGVSRKLFFGILMADINCLVNPKQSVKALNISIK